MTPRPVLFHFLQMTVRPVLFYFLAGDTKKTCEFEKLENTQISRTSGFLDASMLKPAKADCLIKSVANEKWWENGETRPGYCVAFTCRTERGK